MSGVPPAPPPQPVPASATPRTGRLVLGAILILFGVVWLLEVLDVTEFPWEILLPVALILVGVALLVTSRSASGHGGLVATGVVLSVVLLLGSAFDFPIGGGAGDRTYRPPNAAALRPEYRLGVGEITLDLTELEGSIPPGERTRVRLGIGQVLVVVPEDLTVAVRGSAGLGSVVVFGAEEGGLDVEQELAPEGAVLELELSVGLGEVEVRRG
jgi:predicted membrane protein